MNFFIKLVAGIYLLLLVLFVTVCSASKGISNNVSPAAIEQDSLQERISLYEGEMSFIPPAGFKPLTREELKRELPENAKLLLILANADQTGSITVEYDDGMDFQPEQLIEIKRFTEGIHRNYSGWITSEIVEMNGRQWFHFEYETPEMDDLAKLVAPPEEGEKPQKTPDDTPYHLHTYSTVFKGKLVSFGFVSHARHYSQLKEDYYKSIKSIHVKD